MKRKYPSCSVVFFSLCCYKNCFTMPRSVLRWSKKRKFNGVIPTRSGKKVIVASDNIEPGPSETVNVNDNYEVMDVSASSSKISGNLNTSVQDSEKCVEGYRILSMDILNDILSNSICSVCKNGKLSISDDLNSRHGWASKLVVTCTGCEMKKEYFTSSRLECGLFDVNIRLVYALRCLGKGHAAGELFSAVLNMPPPLRNFHTYTTLVNDAATEVAEESMLKAGKECQEINEGKGDIAVTNDGTWMRRGHTSLYGAACIIGVDNGKVLDANVCSKYCHSCSLHSKDDKQSGEYKQWYSNHKRNCSANYEGTSGGMEVAATLKMFGRSEQKHGLRYTKYIGDGDSRAYKAVTEMRPYGDTQITKLECVGHIQKRMGSRLRKLRNDMKGVKLRDGRGLGGKSRLTDKQIDSLQFYYGKSIRENSQSLDKMKMAVWATFLHKASSDEKPQHMLCPKSEDTWCLYNKSQLDGSDYKHKNNLPAAVIEAIKPIYRDLSKPELLEKCLHGKTQNVNEALNAMIWERCPKTSFVGMKTVETAVYDAIVCFNDGNIGRKHILGKMGVVSGVWCDSTLQKLDIIRIQKADFRIETSVKHQRTRKRAATRAKRDTEKEKDENYGAGEH